MNQLARHVSFLLGTGRQRQGQGYSQSWEECDDRGRRGVSEEGLGCHPERYEQMIRVFDSSVSKENGRPAPLQNGRRALTAREAAGVGGTRKGKWAHTPPQ